MKIMKTALVASLVAASALAGMANVAQAHKSKYYGKHHHHNKYKYGVGAAAAVATVVAIDAARRSDCKKWKYRYERTGNPYFLDRYYGCKW